MTGDGPNSADPLRGFPRQPRLATDLEVGLRSKCEATVAKSGSLTLPAKKLFENPFAEARREGRVSALARVDLLALMPDLLD